MILDHLDIESIKTGYHRCAEPDGYICTVCGALFEEGVVYPAEDGRLFTAARAVDEHMASHGNRLGYLIQGDSKYISLTDNQKQLLELMAAGKTDNEIAAALHVSASTIRHQRFMFREKAKHAKMYLAVYDLALGKKQPGGEALMPVHTDMVKVDERFATTEKEWKRILSDAFESQSPLRLRTFARKEKKKIVILNRIAQEFQKGRKYSESEINQILGAIYSDFATLRRYLIEYGYLDRTKNGSEYWVK